MDKIRLLIVSEDYPLSRGLTAIFSAETMFDVIGYLKFDEAISKCIELQPDAILVDVCDKEVTYELSIAQVKKGCPCSMIFVLVDSEQTDISQTLINTIDGIIPRGIMRGCLVKTLELACQAGIFCLPGSYKRSVPFGNVFNKVPENVIGKSDHSVVLDNENLTKREMEVLQLLANNFSNREIATKLYISEPTVKTHVSSILRKLGQSSRAQAIIYSYKTGLVKESLIIPKSNSYS
ncbi:response regulator transcription factor [Desulforamulus aquiferis]|uniref:Stage 0 sporulation protein A homolog n=1 Tax=Desulforamulus aquiferis TaxID=1397668 RepID=A0AAW7ZGU9_9FIRM|nr:response regulator transcription factor [Desulforamulus aquiferis]MDO7788429.1 response regulator transcription factor [Desulforamulus aquiferis]RYD05703.1 hypothetical protein N752_07340 [Desulforamulus aquiferis]